MLINVVTGETFVRNSRSQRLGIGMGGNTCTYVHVYNRLSGSEQDDYEILLIPFRLWGWIYPDF